MKTSRCNTVQSQQLLKNDFAVHDFVTFYGRWRLLMRPSFGRVRDFFSFFVSSV
jgi:hypothetical protein